MHLAKSNLAATILVLLSSTSCNRIAAYEWRTLAAPDGTFSVSLPGDAVTVDTPTKSVTGGSFISHRLNVRASKDAAFGCSWWEDPSRPRDRTAEQILDTARDIRGITHGNAAYDNRIVIVGNRLYTLLVIDTSGRQDTESIERFFNSLRFH